ncbi:FecR family protein [Sphingomonas endolithica]|uniref:FecR family protein n=1 Tax=Sphingomonas endolithica TaxID=2972485 RepID=UPI0021AF8687|nr:FecR domain-containing protein [Sphingomonas sp. ZFBP2030]
MAKHTDENEALDWVVRVGDRAFDDWDAFQAWLDADPAHAARYQALATDIDDMVALVPPEAQPALVPLAVPVARHRGRWIGGALAASLALVVGYATLRHDAAPYVLETPAGGSRTVALADGSAITMSGGTRVTLDRNDARVATLDRGQAMFEIRHDAEDPFEVTVGDRKVVDVGTAFDLKRTGDETRVAVSEGAVDFIGDADPVRLVAGQGLVARDRAAPVMSSPLDIASVGAWRSGSLAYDGAPIAEVAGDLSRSLGLRVTADRSVAARPFFGVVVIADIKRDPRQMAGVLDLTARQSGNAWVLTAKP